MCGYPWFLCFGGQLGIPSLSLITSTSLEDVVKEGGQLREQRWALRTWIAFLLLNHELQWVAVVLGHPVLFISLISTLYQELMCIRAAFFPCFQNPEQKQTSSMSLA
jgi:hypothetical protein